MLRHAGSGSRGRAAAVACPRRARAGLAGRSESWLSQAGRGLRQADIHSVLVSLADILHADVRGPGAVETCHALVFSAKTSRPTGQEPNAQAAPA